MCTPHFPLAIPASISLTFPTQAKQFLPLWKCTSYLTLMHHFCPGAWTNVLPGDPDDPGENIRTVYGPRVGARFNTKILHLFVFYRKKKKSKPRFTWKRGKYTRTFQLHIPPRNETSLPSGKLLASWKSYQPLKFSLF